MEALNLEKEVDAMGRKAIPKARLDKAMEIWQKHGWSRQGIKEAAKATDISERKLYYERAKRKSDELLQKQSSEA